MKKLKNTLIILLALILLLVGGGYLYTKSQLHHPQKIALAAAKQATKETNSYLYFKAHHPKENKPTVIFYQGALVDAASYSSLALKLATNGYNVYLLKSPLDLVILAPNQAKLIVQKRPKQTYVVGGHSLGGVVASRFAAKATTSNLRGVFFLASYPDKKGSLAHKKITSLSITASHDQVLNWKNYRVAKQYLPQAAVFGQIKGGNHAGFGNYGKQKHDGTATISNATQQTKIAQLLTAWLKTIQ
ncbi:alpha/beta hydrolase [Loigolactobacillus iwatensis]|uniref:alpha/beta hydrolase n=1 Tax=Loigolactobacillus iwatensis TaxID=1267156 RepID=UPI000F7E4FD0|nr:alpha/beta hydrolase [Loigolactobacillus iwatensis]